VDNKEIKNMCLDLLHADNEELIIQILKDKNLWDDFSLWRYYGDDDSNYSIIGSQQSRPEAALVEKIVNSVDAVLMGKCWSTGISPEDPMAPKSIDEAVAIYFFGDAKKSETYGHLSSWSPQKRTEISRLITLAATGSRASLEGARNPCFTICDAGEGQTPNSLPVTILSLHKKNKQKIQFVQGKFNMGGTGVMRFCGHHNLQLIISKRNPNIVKWGDKDDSAMYWCMTIVRREDPPPGEKSSVYTYLAPENSGNKPRHGEVLRFLANALSIFPSGQTAYSIEAEWGTCIKLYEYELTGTRSHILRRGGLLSKLDILMPEIALPIRLHECRYGGEERSFETTLSGLSVRLEDDKANNIEENFPLTSPLKVSGEQLTAKIYAFKKNKEESYKKNEGIIFTINGQTHGYFGQGFFNSQKVGMGRLADSLLVFIDCDKMSGRAREDLFMNSRDRLTNGELREAIDTELEIMLREHQALKDLRERRRREEMETKLSDSKPLQDTLESIMKSYPSLASLFSIGTRLSNPFKAQEVAAEDIPYKGKLYPTYFKFQKLNYGELLQRTTAINMRCRITFETDVVNDYFARTQNKGTFTLHVNINGRNTDVTDFVLNLENGKATLSMRLPRDVKVGDSFPGEAMVYDDTLVFPFINRFFITVGPAQIITPPRPPLPGKPPGPRPGKGREIPESLALPEIHQVYEAEWDKRDPKFDRFSALQIIQEKATIDAENDDTSAPYSFYVNMDNVYFKTAAKQSKTNPDVLKARFTYGLVLFGMALIRGESTVTKSEESQGKEADEMENNGSFSLEKKVFQVSSAIAPIVLPLIDSLGSLDEEQIKSNPQLEEEE